MKHNLFSFSSGNKSQTLVLDFLRCGTLRLRWPLLGLLFVGLCLANDVALAQSSNCSVPPCYSLELVIEPVNSNVNTDSDDCDTPLSECAACDPERQLLYDVQIRAVPLGSTSAFNLDYEQLFLSVALNVSSPSSGYYSRINQEATLACSKGILQSWSEDPEPLFNANENSVSLELNDLLIDNCPENVVMFVPETIGGDPYLVAHLFFVVVDAFPGETLSLVVDDFLYDPSSGGPCDLNDLALSQISNAPSVTINDPSSPLGGPEIKLLVGSPITVSGTNEEEVTILLKNQSVNSVTIYYVEYVAVFEDVNGTMQAPVFTPNPALADCSFFVDHVGDQWFYHFIFQSTTGVSCSSGNTLDLATLRIKPPQMMNLCWESTLRFLNDGSARFKTNVGCTGLDVSSYVTDIASNTSDCDPACTGDYTFSVDLIGGNECGVDRQVRIGFLTSPAEEYLVQTFEAKISFDLAPNVSIDAGSINLGNWACSSSSCHSISGNTITFNLYASAGQNIEFGTDFITFELTGDGCVNGATVERLVLGFPSFDECVPALGTFTGFPSCSPLISGVILTEDNQGVENVLVNIVPDVSCTGSSCSAEELTAANGNYSRCLCNSCEKFTVVPELNDDPTNGVTTFDLVLINRHILNLEPLPSPYKMIAADANKSNTITTFDIVEIRKLILGIYNEFPSNNSWRFFDADFPFQNNPFADDPGDHEAVTISLNSNANFVGVKVGDVNLTVDPNRPSARPITTLNWDIEIASCKVGNTITLPIVYTGTQPLEAYQLGLRFDPDRLQLIGPSAGDLPYGPDLFGLKKVAEGEIRTLWHPVTHEDETIAPGTVLFYLTFKVLNDLPADAPLLTLDDSVLYNAAWQFGGLEYALAEQKAPAERSAELNQQTVTATCQPNPTTGLVTLEVQSQQATRARLGIFGPFGELIETRNLDLIAGLQTFNVEALTGKPAGVYSWKLWNPTFKMQGHLIKL